MSPATGRREANKQATRAALRQAAEQLFASQGYEATSVIQIAATAHVGERTFYRYFDGKEELLAERALAWIARLQEAIRTRPADETPYQAVAHAMIAAVTELAPDAEDAWLLSNSPKPLALLRQVEPRPMKRLERAIASAVLARLSAAPSEPSQPPGEPTPPDEPTLPGEPAAEFEAQLLARIAMAALRTAAAWRREHEGAGGPGIEQLLADAFASLTRLTGPHSFTGSRREDSATLLSS